MERQEDERQDVERIMRRAAELGHDPQRVARALRHRSLPPAEPQPTMRLKRRSSVRRVRSVASPAARCGGSAVRPSPPPGCGRAWRVHGGCRQPGAGTGAAIVLVGVRVAARIVWTVSSAASQ